MIDYDSFSRCHLTDIFFRFSHGSERVKNELITFCTLRLVLKPIKNPHVGFLIGFNDILNM